MGLETLTSSAELGHRPGLDGLRAVAVTIVVAFHAGVLDGGWVGVDIFFVLSGWLITGLLLAEIRTTERFDVAAFWRRRVRRLLPALIVTLAFVTVLAMSGAIDLRRRGVVGALTYTTNWLNITGPDGYWDSFAAPDPLQHLWSLAVEEQIYLLWPALVVVLLRVVPTHRRVAAVRVAAGLIAVASVGIAVYGTMNNWSIDRLYQGTDTRANAFALGALTAGLTIPRLGDRLRHLIVVVAVLLALAIGVNGGSIDLFRGPIHIVTLCGVIAVASAAAIRTGPLCWTPLRRFGAWSYGIYLVHYPINVALRDHLEGIWLVLAVMALSTPLAALSHHLIEQPIRRRGLPGRRIVVGLSAATAVAVTAVAVAVPITPTGLDDLPSLDAAPVSAVPTVTGSSDTSSPSTPPPDAPRRIMVIGDSVPALAADELAVVAAERGDVLGAVAREACIGSPHPADQFLADDCAGFIDSLGDGIAAQQPDIVVWWWGGVGASQSWNGSPLDVCSLGGFTAASEQVAWQVGLTGDARPVIVIPPARTDLDLEGREGTVCQAAALADAAERQGIEVLRLDEFMCPDIRNDCERVPRDDGLHVDDEGALTVARWLWDQPPLHAID